MLAGGVIALIKLPSVQTWVVGRVANYMSKQLNTTVQIDAVDIRLFSKIVLKGLYVEDLQHDTLLHAADFEADISGFDFEKQRFVIEKAVLTHPRIKIIRYENIPGLNFDFLADYFAGGSADTAAQAWDIRLKTISLDNAVFSYRDKRWNDTTICVDYEDMHVSGLNLVINDLQQEGDSIKFRLEKMQAREKSGFVVKNLSANMLISPRDFAFYDLTIKTPFSEVEGDVHFTFDSWGAFDNFEEEVKIQSLFDKSIVASEDVKYFAKELFGLDKSVSFKGNVKGSIANLKGKELEIIYTQNCYFKGDIQMNGLPDFEETFIDLYAQDLTINKKDIETLNTFPFDEGKRISLPDNISELGKVRFKGKFTGFYSDFVAYGDAQTALGFFSSDVNLKLGEGDQPPTYSGTLITHNFNIGRLLRIKDVGTITSKVKVKGHGLALERLNTKLEGTVSQLSVKGYDYQGIEVNGQVQRRLFKGYLTVKDPNADLDFIGTIDYSGRKPVFDFSADIRTARLGILNIVDRDETSNLSTKAEMHFTGSRIDDLEGSLHFSETNYMEFPRGITINNLLIESGINGSYRNILLQSDFADARLTGEYKLSSVLQSALTVLSRYIPSIPVRKAAQNSGRQVFDYHVYMKETRGVLDVFVPELSILAGTRLEGRFDTREDEFTAALNSDEIIYKGIRFEGVDISGITQDGSLKINAVNRAIAADDSLVFRNVRLHGETSRDSADLSLIVANTDSSISRINWDFHIAFLGNGYSRVNLVTNEFLLEKTNWQISDSNYILFDITGILFSNVNFTSGKQFAGVNGIAGNDSSSVLEIKLVEFNSSLLNNVLKIYNANIGGTADGTVKITGITGKPKIDADMKVRQFSWFNDTLGDAEVVSEWNTKKGRIEIDGLVTRGGEKNIDVSGAYIIKEVGDEVDFDISLRKTYIKTFSPYLEGVFSNISGIASGEFRLYGLATAPQLTGKAHLQKVGFKVDYLNTFYSFSSDVILDENEISFEEVLINDIRGNKAIATGKVLHDNLRDFYFDIDITADRTQLLNTTPKDNELFYGVGYGSGKINISGYLDYITMDIAIRTEKGTHISIPLNNPEEVSQSSFITFLQTDTISRFADTTFNDLSGIEINMDFEVTTDALVELIFDDKIGDVIEGRGTGNLTMKVNDADGFLMFGNYYIEEGQYTFTLQNVISKPFSIEKGGTISWTGDPYDADVSINAVYSRLRVGLYDLLLDTASGYRKPVPVELRLTLTEKLFNPVIRFDIEVPNIDAATASRIDRYINTEEEKFRQAVSLLILRRFSPPPDLANRPNINSSSAVGQNAYEFLSQQLSNWASQINENVDVGINYNPGSTLTQEELELALSTSFFNDRLVVEGNVGVANSNSGATQNTTNIAGDFSAEVKASKDGKIRLKAFNRSNNNSLINNLNSQYTQGIGVFYREEFNKLSDLTRRWKERMRRNKDKQEPATGTLP